MILILGFDFDLVDANGSLQQKVIVKDLEKCLFPCIILNRDAIWRGGRVVEGAALEML